jgi:hypothetical protein
LNMTANYKLQAERLAEHFSDVHRFRLKPSRALEAIAAVHGARDWNTLQACPRPAEAPSRGTAATTQAVSSLFAPLDLGNAQVVTQVLSHRMTVSGADSEARAAVLKRLVAHQASRGAAVYFDLSTQGRGEKVLRLLGEHSPNGLSPISIDPISPAMPSFDALAGSDVDHATSMLVNLLPPNDSPGADYYRAQAQAILKAVLSALHAANQRPTLARIRDLLLSPERAGDLIGGLPEEWLSSLTREMLISKDFPKHAGALLGRLQLLLNAFGDTLSPEGQPSFSWTDSWREGRSVYVRASGAPVASTIGALLRDSLTSALATANQKQALAVFIVGEGAQEFAIRGGLVRAAQKAGAGILAFDARQDLVTAGESAGFDVSASVSADEDAGQLCLQELVGRERRSVRISFPVERSF